MSFLSHGRIQKLRQSPAFNYICVALLGIGTGLFALLAASSLYGMPMFWAYLRSPAVLALNILPAVLLVLGLFFATGRAWISFIVPSLPIIALACVNFFKIQLRGDAFIAEDFAHAAEAGKFVSDFTLEVNWKIVLCVAYLVLGTVFAAIFLRHRVKGWRKRLIASALTLGITLGVGIPVYASDDIYKKVASDYRFSWPNPTEEFITRGFVFPFLHSVRAALPTPPDDYSEEAVVDVLAAYEYDNIPEDKRVNVISVMLEAFTDLSEYDSLEFLTDVYEGWHRLQEESISGHLIANIFGGGTIDTERLFLIGETSLRTINNKSQSYLYYFKDQGYYIEGFHPGDRWFYNRENVHRDIGFDNYYFLEDFEGAEENDAYFFTKLLELYDARDKSVPYFSHNLTIQNHGAYYEDQNYGTGMISPEGLTEASYNILSNYLVGIYDTNNRIYEFIDELRYDAEPVVVVIYGDHKPWLGNYESVYRELGISMDTTTGTGLYNMYSTPYIIWANEAAKATLGTEFSGEGGDISPCFLMNNLFAVCGWGGDEYMKLSNEVLVRAPIINTPTGIYVENGELTLEPSEQTQELLQELEKAAYYRRNDF